MPPSDGSDAAVVPPDELGRLPQVGVDHVPVQIHRHGSGSLGTVAIIKVRGREASININSREQPKGGAC